MLLHCTAPFAIRIVFLNLYIPLSFHLSLKPRPDHPFLISADYLLGLGKKQVDLSGLDPETAGLIIRLVDSLVRQKRDGK